MEVYVKKLYFLLMLGIALLLGGCSNKSSGNSNPVSPIAGITGGNNGGTKNNVAFEVNIVQDQQQNNYFEFTPNTEVTLTKVVVNCAAANVTNQQVQDDGTTVYSGTNPINLGPVTIPLQSGQQWVFIISGKIGSSTGQDYTSDASFTIP